MATGSQAKLERRVRVLEATVKRLAKVLCILVDVGVVHPEAWREHYDFLVEIANGLE